MIRCDEITKAGFEGVADLIADNYPQLEKLNLNFQRLYSIYYQYKPLISCGKIYTESVKKVINTLGNKIKNLQSLNLNLSRYTKTS